MIIICLFINYSVDAVMCQSSDSANSIPAKPLSRRLKLWEIHHHFHCSILGTCLTMAELRKVARQSNCAVDASTDDFLLHSHMVAESAKKERTARNLQRMLDRKYHRWIQQLKGATSDCFETLWKQALQGGDIPGLLWALMTHPETNGPLITRIHQQVHMLSHIQGSENRADLHTRQQLHNQVTELQQKLEDSQRAQQLFQKQQEGLFQAQEKALSALRQQQQKQTEEPTTDISDLKQQMREKDKDYRQLLKRLEWTEDRLAQREMRLTEVQQGLEGLKDQLQEAHLERQALELNMTALLPAANGHPNTEEPVASLDGQQLIYVGGRSKMLPHLRALTEAHNGQLIHHDGGLEDSRAGLQNSLVSADLVFCAIDCVSHDACLKVKRYCKKHNKPFIPLRSSSLSAFSGGLRTVLEQNKPS